MNSAQRDQCRNMLQSQGFEAGESLEKFLDICAFQQVDKDITLIKTGEPARDMWAISKGLVRLVYQLDDGRERNKAFYAEGSIFGPISAGVTENPSPFSIETMEPCHLFYWSFQDMQDLVYSDMELLKLFYNLLAHAFIRNEQREAVLLNFNAEKRFLWLLENEPQWLDRIQQFHLASYLGIEAVSFSRLKKQLKA